MLGRTYLWTMDWDILTDNLVIHAFTLGTLIHCPVLVGLKGKGPFIKIQLTCMLLSIVLILCTIDYSNFNYHIY